MQVNKEYSNCLRCGRKLKSEESKKLGFGKICFEKWQHETEAKKLFDMENANELPNSSDTDNK